MKNVKGEQVVSFLLSKAKFHHSCKCQANIQQRLSRQPNIGFNISIHGGINEDPWNLLKTRTHPSHRHDFHSDFQPKSHSDRGWIPHRGCIVSMLNIICHHQKTPTHPSPCLNLCLSSHSFALIMIVSHFFNFIN